jgi:uncharacterized protein (DUF2147 family)
MLRAAAGFKPAPGFALLGFLRIEQATWRRLCFYATIMKSSMSLGLLTLALIGACALAVSCGKKDEGPSAAASPDSKGTNTTSAAASHPEFAKLAGKWERPDGGYVLEIKGVDAAGTMQAAYFNPKPINVSRAAALYKDGAAKVFVELRDENYPGSTYNLTYDPQSDQLYGQYFQAALRQTFDVTFARMK